MYRPAGLNRILMMGSALAQLAAVVPLGAPVHSASERKLERKSARHTHRPKWLGSLKYGSNRSRPPGAASTLAKTRRLLARQAAEGLR